MNDSDFCTIAEASRITGYARNTIDRLIKRRKLIAYRDPNYIRGPVKIPRSEVERLKAERTALSS